ncbi:uncharacterized protein JN550_006038 [Neoarthrinium moseri]|uniref:uncharacterized protein n=1 Tax=Neoarthrinium moseri TaxID=1658444 RepID=UPI001FDE8F2A|nr:uncharacterized protein JN550_006038 [Neoarthrinium moseri]KAI1869051.1 hypothetical protein JN550_006038 [Neoarthrinium moseri]
MPYYMSLTWAECARVLGRPDEAIKRDDTEICDINPQRLWRDYELDQVRQHLDLVLDNIQETSLICVKLDAHAVSELRGAQRQAYDHAATDAVWVLSDFEREVGNIRADIEEGLSVQDSQAEKKLIDLVSSSLRRTNMVRSSVNMVGNFVDAAVRIMNLIAHADGKVKEVLTEDFVCMVARIKGCLDSTPSWELSGLL